MTKLILHVGPGKCGSSTIQHFFNTHDAPCEQSTYYNLLDPNDIKELDSERPEKINADSLLKQVFINAAGKEALILSHEVLFQSPCAVKNICSLAKDITTEIVVVGYSRRQSDFIVSAYSQWLFRSEQRVREVNEVLKAHNLDGELFTGLEKQLIASINNDFHSARQLSGHSILNWQKSYDDISKIIKALEVKIECGVLPKPGSDVNLIEDFCRKSGLTLDHSKSSAIKKSENASFDHDVVEAINVAVSLGLEVPGPHESNDLIQRLSSKYKSTAHEESEFLRKLKSYIDTSFQESNSKLCRQYGLDEAYFAPLDICSKPEILRLIADEAEKRTLNRHAILKSYQGVSARLVELCLTLAEERKSSAT